MALDMDKLVALCKRRGFIFQSSEVYGGISGFWDYGPLGVELKRNVKEAWWNDMVRNPPIGPHGNEISMVGLDCSIIMNPKVWEASGHVGGFADPMVDCKSCRKRLRADKVFIAGFAAEATATPTLICFEADNATDAAPMADEEYAKRAKKKKMAGGLQRVQLFSAATGKQDGVYPCPMPDCDGKLTEPRNFNLMFQTYVGALQDASSVAYLRPETAQGIFANFKNVLDSSRLKVPFGIAQIGKAFRNEINPRNYTFRSREFEQMEIEFFCPPDQSQMWYQWWRDVRIKWYSQLGIQSQQLRPREQGKEELAHYSIGTTDIEYMFPFSDEPQELEGVAHRGAYDLTQHQTHSGKDLSYFDEAGWEKDKAQYGTGSFKEWAKRPESAALIAKYSYIPHVIEPSAGADRFTLAVLCEAYREDKLPNDKGELEERIYMKFHPRLAPVKAAIFPLVKKEGMPEKAQALYRELKKHFNVFYDDTGAVGRRYRRQDEIGTPFCLTIDGDTIKDDTVTIRDCATAKQRRIPIASVLDEIRKAMEPTI